MRIAILAAAALVIAAPAFAQEVPTEEARMKAFTDNDKNKDGKLDKAEYEALLKQLGFAEALEQLWTQRDANKDGFISAEEYKNPVG